MDRSASSVVIHSDAHRSPSSLRRFSQRPDESSSVGFDDPHDQQQHHSQHHQQHTHVDGDEHSYRDEEEEQPSPISDWLARYKRNSFILPHAFTSTQRILSSPLATATVEAPGRAVQSQLLAPPSFRFPYSLSFGKAISLPLPQDVSNSYLDSNRPLLLQLRVSLFDLETNAFFGRTWVDPMQYDLRNMPENHVQWNDNDEFSPHYDTRSLDRESNDATEDEEYEEEEDDDEDDEDDDDDDEGEEDDDEEESEERDDDRDDNTEASSQVRARDLRQRKTKKAKKNIARQASKISNITGGNDEPIKITGHRVTVDLAERVRVGLHITACVKSPKVKLISVQSTIFRGGLDPFSTWSIVDSNPQAQYSPSIYDKSTFPIYIGSPRALMFIGPFLKENLTGYPILLPIPGASVTFTFAPRPDLRVVTMLWQENLWISAEDDIPGVGNFDVNVNGTISCRSFKTKLCKINVSVYPSVRRFEELALAEYVEAFNNAFPDTLAKLSNGTIAPAEIVERRLHIGYHNTQVFLSPPSMVTLQPAYNDDLGGDAFHLVFNGNIELDKYLPGDPGIAVVCVMDFRIALKVNQEVAKKTSMFTAIMEKLTGGGNKPQQPNVVDVERVVTLGWFVWTPHLFQGENPILNPVLTQTPMNPYSTLVLTPDVRSLTSSSISLEPFARSFGRYANEDVPLCLSFSFNEEEEAERSRSPIQERALTPRSVNFPTEEEYDEVETQPPISPKRASVKIKAEEPDFEADENDEELVAQSIMPRPPSKAEVDEKKRAKRDLITRSERARLAKAGFAPFLDVKGEKPFVVNAAGREKANVKTNFNLERKDGLKVNEVTVELLAVSFYENSFVGADLPTSVYFSFDFYNFGTTFSERASIYTGPLPIPTNHDRPNHIRSSSVPTNRHSRNWSHYSNQSFRSNVPIGVQPGDGKPNAGGGNLEWPAGKPGWSQSFEVDGEHDPTPALSAYRNDVSSFVYYLGFHSIDIDLWDGDSMLYLGTASLELRHCLRQGQGGVMAEYDADIVIAEDSVNLNLHPDRQINDPQTRVIGRLHVRLVNIGKSSSHPLRSDDASMLKKRANPFEKSSLIIRDFRAFSLPKGETLANPKRMVEIDTELSDLLRITFEDRRQKLIEESSSSRKHGGLVTAKESLRKLEKIDQVKQFFRGCPTSGSKIDGESTNFSYQVTRQDRQRDLETISIYRERKKPILIENALIKYMTTTYSIPASYGQAFFFEFIFTNPYEEEHLFEINSADNELSFVEPPSHTHKYNAPEASIPREELQGGNPMSRIIKEPLAGDFQNQVSIFNQKQTPVALLNVCISMTDAFVDRTFRFFRPEGEHFRQRIRSSIVSAEAVSGEVDFNPIFEASTPLQRLDVTCVVGQTNAASLVVRGTSFTRTVQGFSNKPHELSLSSPGPFSLVASVLNEVNVMLRPKRMIDKSCILNFFDMERRVLVSSWMVVSHCASPSVTRSYEIIIPKGKAVNKRVSYKNPYPTRKTFYLQTNAEDVLQFREGTALELEAGASQYISFRFLPVPNIIAKEILVFLNDENDKIEECLRIGINYK
ncbi:Nephrocystin-4 [Dinochytrium kinnereticum]|nr:Nephrocystin-4 [Dinochytrium kinnereticum]